MDESGMGMDSSDEDEAPAVVEKAPVAAAPAPVEEVPAPAPVSAACAEKEVFGDVLDLMDESGMCMDSDSDNEESENTSSGDISDLSTESLKEVEKAPTVPAPDVKIPAAEAV